MRSGPWYLAVIPYNDDGDNNLRTLQQSWLLSLALSLEALCFFHLLFLPLVASILTRFLFFLAYHPSRFNYTVPRGLSQSFRFSLTRKFADPIFTKLHCVSHLHAVALTYSVRNCTLPSVLSLFIARCNRYFIPTCTNTTMVAHLPQPAFTSRTWKKNLPFQPLRFVSLLE